MLNAEKSYTSQAYNFTGPNDLPYTNNTGKMYEHHFDPELLFLFDQKVFVNQPIDTFEPPGEKSATSKFLKELQNYVDSQPFKSEWIEEVEKSR